MQSVILYVIAFTSSQSSHYFDFNAASYSFNATSIVVSPIDLFLVFFLIPVSKNHSFFSQHVSFIIISFITFDFHSSPYYFDNYTSSDQFFYHLSCPNFHA